MEPPFILFYFTDEIKNCSDIVDIIAIQGDIHSLFRPLPG